jgi:hypothetical protein
MIKPVAESTDQPLDIEALLVELATKIERVKVLYEQYFMGIEKIEPLVPRKDIQRTMLMLQQMYIRNTGLRFKFNTLLQKWNIYITYWNRTLREIESGTYVRHVKRAERQAQKLGQELPPEMHRKKQPSGVFDAVGRKKFLDEDSEQQVIAAADLARLKGPAPKDDLLERVPAARAPGQPPPIPLFSAPPTAAAARKPPPPVPAPKPSVPGMSEPELRALHQKYVDARKQTGESAQVSYEKLCESLAKQAPRLMAQPGVAKVRFDVDVKDGKAVLKAIPIKAPK